MAAVDPERVVLVYETLLPVKLRASPAVRSNGTHVSLSTRVQRERAAAAWENGQAEAARQRLA